MQNNLAQALTNSLSPKFAISYLRVSSPNQAERGGGDDEGFSIPAQREANKRKAHSIGAMVGKEFVDRGTSARSADRPELQKMLSYIKENRDRVDYLIVHKVDRLARNRGDDVDITRILKDANVQLVSASESIDNTPSGILLHGIMSSIAEFYSANLSTEVKKGMGQKVKSGGTPTKAPIGYKNIRAYDERGRRDSRVEVDELRAPLIKLAFELYATGNWSIRSLAEHMADRGLGTPQTLKLPGKPINKRMLHFVLSSPYYKGIVTYNGATYKGKHQAIIDEPLWDKVQEILKAHNNGEKDRIHDHYLKSTVYCGKCGARLIICNAKSRSGARYPYFVCSAKHNKRNNCNQHSLLIDEVAAKIEQLYEQISFTPQFRQTIQHWVSEQIDQLEGQKKAEFDRLKSQKDKLEREQRKLLEAHYADAIPLNLLKEEQERITRSIKSITTQMEAYKSENTQIKQNLDDIFELLEDCGKIYRLAGDYEKRCFNQALFKRILVYDDMTLEGDYAEPFDTLLDSNVFTKKSNGQTTAHCSFSDTSTPIKTQTCTNFFSAGLSITTLVRITVPNLKNSLHSALRCKAAIKKKNPSLAPPESTESPEPTNPTNTHPFGKDVKMIRQHKLHCRLLTPAEQDEAVAQYQNGLSMAAVSNLYGCHYTVIGRLLRQRGVVIR